MIFTNVTFGFFDKNLFPFESLLIMSFVLADQYEFINHYIQNLFARTLRLYSKHRKILNQYFNFYLRLSHHSKYAFEEKVADFMFSKNFRGDNGLNVTTKMKVLISAYAAQLTFGLEPYYFESYHNITIHRSKFRSSVSNELVTWELDQYNTIHVSWYHLYTQCLQQNPKEQIGLQLMSHLLRIENKELHLFEFFDKTDETDLVKNGNSLDGKLFSTDLFSKEQLNNREKFVEAALVNYFAYPNELFTQYPHIFKKLDTMLYKSEHEA